MSAAAESSEEPRSVPSLLLDRRFGPYYLGKLVSAAGVWVQNIVAAILVFELTGSALAVGTVSVVQFLPQILLAPLGGVLCDRVDRRRLLMGGRSVAFLASGSLAVYVGVLGIDGMHGPWAVYAMALTLGIGHSFSAPAMQSLIAGLVPRRDLDVAVALNSSTGNIARAIGPAVGAGLYVAVGPAWAFGLTAGAHGFYIAALTLVKNTPIRRAADSSLRGGFRYLRRTPIMVVLLVCVAALGFALDPIITLGPPLAELLGAGDVVVGVMASAFGGGALVALACLGALRRRLGLARLGTWGFGLLTAGMLGLALSQAPWMAVAAMAVGGYGFLLATTSLTSRLQRRVPDDLRGRVMSLYVVCFLGSRPVAATINGAVADYLSVRAALGFTALLCVLAGVLAVRKAPVGRGRADPAAAPQEEARGEPARG